MAQRQASNMQPAMSVDLVKMASQRRDTKDSGYGGCSSECEDEPQILPEWCCQCLQEVRECNANVTFDYENVGKKYTENKESGEDYVDDQNIPSCEYREFKEIEERQNHESANEDSTRSSNSLLKPAKRHRRMTPVPVSTPIKIGCISSPDCLFVEEEDNEDIQNFYLEDDFVDQGFLQILSSPRGSPKLLNRANDTNTELHKMEVKEDHGRSIFSSSACTEEVTKLQESPRVARNQQRELLETENELIPAPLTGHNTSEKLIALPRLYMRSRSENDARSSSQRIRRRNQLARVDSDIDHATAETTNEDVLRMSSSECSSKGRMTSKDIPHIELQPAASLPDWMKEAKAEDISIELSTEDTSRGNEDGCPSNIKKKEEPSVKMRSNEIKFSWTAAKQNEILQESEMGEEIMKIYTPQKDYEGKKPRRSRKLTPARAASPSLEKLADLQSQIYAFTLKESDSD